MVGADLIEVPAAPYSNPNNYIRYSGRLAEMMAKTEPYGAIWANQFDNLANRRGHYETTGPEIWEQTQGRIDGFVSAVGTGGTLAGVGMALKERNHNVKIALADPFGASLYSYYTRGALESEGSSVTEGIGQSRITANLEIRAGRSRLSHRRRRGAADRFRPGRTGGPVARRLIGNQYRRGDPVGARTWSWPHDRHDAVQLGRALRLEAIQPGLPARKGPADAELAGPPRRHPAGVRLMTVLLFRDEPYRRDVEARVIAVSDAGIALDATVFYPRGGGQPGDRGAMVLADGSEIAIVDAVYDADRSDDSPCSGGRRATTRRWRDRRRAARLGDAPQTHARPHRPASAQRRAALPVTGGSVGDGEGRLDFDSGEAAVDKADVEARLNALIAADAEVRTRWISDEELAANPGLVKTMSVKPPTGAGRVRLIEIVGLDLQPCGGTHVARTGEIGRAVVTGVEKKGRINRRVRIALASANP